jgi:hypothetical protein
MSTGRLRWKTLLPLLIVLLAGPWLVRSGWRSWQKVKIDRVVKAAAQAPIPAFTAYINELVRPNADRSSPPTIAAQLVIAQKSNGDSVEQTTRYPGTPMQLTIRTIKLSDGTIVHTSDTVNLKTTWKGSITKANQITIRRAYKRNPTAGCAADSFGNEVSPMVHYMAKGSKFYLGTLQTFVFSKSDPDETMQVAPQLDCLEVYRFTVFKNATSVDSSERVTTAYQIGEPSASLFATNGLTEASPITAFQTLYRRIKWPEDKIQQHTVDMQTSEQQYSQQP